MKRKAPDCYGEYDREKAPCKECWAGEGCIQLTVLKNFKGEVLFKANKNALKFLK